MAKGIHPNTLAALEPTMYKKGKKPTGGRPKGSLSLKERFAKYIDIQTPIKMPDGSIKDVALMESIILSLLAKASKGEVKAVKEVFDRVYGKESQKLEVTGKDGMPLQAGYDQRLSEIYERSTKAFDSGPALSDPPLIEK